jgi:Zn ribbon nucleic-acid-binding protein
MARCPRCDSENVLDLMAFERHVELAQCSDCLFEFGYDMDPPNRSSSGE